MSTGTNSLDALFEQIDQVAENLEKASKASGNKKSKNTEFKNLDMTFLGAVTGTYEMKPFVDSEGKLVEEIYLHTVKTSTAKVTVPCKGEGCTLCALQEKLDKMKNKAAWKYKPYKTNKILVKIGDSQVEALKSGTVYVAYVDDSFFKPLVESIRTNKKYYPNELGSMLQAKESSAGMVVNASRGAKKTSYNFNFIAGLKISAVNEKEVFGHDKYKLENLGFFRKNYINATKLATAESILQKLILATADKAVEKKEAEAPKADEVKTAPEEVQAKTETTPEVKVEEPQVTNTIEATQIDPNIKDPKSVGANGNPNCFGYFDPNSDVCSQNCQHKRLCLLDSMENGRI